MEQKNHSTETTRKIKNLIRSKVLISKAKVLIIDGNLLAPQNHRSKSKCDFMVCKPIFFNPIKWGKTKDKTKNKKYLSQKCHAEVEVSIFCMVCGAML